MYSFIPLLFIFLYNFYSNFSNTTGRKRKIFGILFIILFSLIMLSSFSVGFYIALFLAVFHIVFVTYLLKSKIITVKQVFVTGKNYWREIVLYLCVGIISISPFIWIYLPVYSEMGARNWGDVLVTAPQWYDFFNVSTTNLLWEFPQLSRPLDWEFRVGYPLITGILLIVGCVFYIKKFFVVEKNQKKIDLYVCIVCFSLTIALISLMALRIGDYTLWYFVFRIFPAASAIRVIVRVNHFLTLPVGIVIAYFLYEKVRFKNVRALVLVCIVLISVIFLEHQNRHSFTHWTKSYIYGFLDNVVPPPETVESFVMVNNTSSHPVTTQLDAWSIANHFGINTIHGYSSQFPRNWWGIWNMEETRNYSNICMWVNEHGLENIYLYNVIENTWQRYSEQAIWELEDSFINFYDYQLGTIVDLTSATGSVNSVYQNNGWWIPEENGTWILGRRATLAARIESNNALLLNINITNVFNDDPIDVYVNDIMIGSYNLELGRNTIRIPEGLNQNMVISFVVSNPRSPMEMGYNLDSRIIAAVVEYFYIIEE
jgi:hypothetical protein